MRKMEELFRDNEKIWFRVPMERRQQFYEELVTRNARFANGDCIKPELIGELMGVGKDGTIGYISYFIWYQSFGSVNCSYLKVDYGKYHDGEEDYVITIE